MNHINSRNLVIGSIAILIAFVSLAFYILAYKYDLSLRYNEAQRELVEMQVQENIKYEDTSTMPEPEFEVDPIEGLRSQDGESYREVDDILNAIEAKYSVNSLSRNQIPDLYVTDPTTKEKSINKDYTETAQECCKKIPLYRWNTLTEQYDLLVSDLRVLKGYVEYIDEYPIRSTDDIFSWSEGGRYIVFERTPWESLQTGGDIYLDTQNLDAGFRKFDVFFSTWLVSPDRTKALGQKCDYSDDVICEYNLFDFNTAKVTSFFKEDMSAEILEFGVMSVGVETWPYLHWIDNSRVEFFTINSGARDAIMNCVFNAEYKTTAEETFGHCNKILQENFSTLKHHVVDVSGTI